MPYINYANPLGSYDPEETDDSAFIGGIKAGVQGLGSSFKNLGGALGRVVGADEYAAAREREADAYTAAAQEAGSMIPRLADVDSLGGAYDWTTGMIGQNLPLFGAMAASNMLGGAAGSALMRKKALAASLGRAANKDALAVAAKQAMNQEVVNEFAQRAERQAFDNAMQRTKLDLAIREALGSRSTGGKIGSYTGTVAPYFMTTAGDTYGAIRTDPEATGTPEEQAWASLGSGAAQTALGTVFEPVIGAIPRAMRQANVIKAAAGHPVGAKAALRELGLAALGEGVTETGEQAIQQTTQQQFNPNMGYDVGQLIEAGLGGAVVGGAFSAPSALHAALRKPETAVDPVAQLQAINTTLADPAVSILAARSNTEDEDASIPQDEINRNLAEQLQARKLRLEAANAAYQENHGTTNPNVDRIIAGIDEKLHEINQLAAVPAAPVTEATRLEHGYSLPEIVDIPHASVPFDVQDVISGTQTRKVYTLSPENSQELSVSIPTDPRMWNKASRVIEINGKPTKGAAVIELFQAARVSGEPVSSDALLRAVQHDYRYALSEFERRPVVYQRTLAGLFSDEAPSGTSYTRKVVDPGDGQFTPATISITKNDETGATLSLPSTLDGLMDGDIVYNGEVLEDAGPVRRMIVDAMNIPHTSIKLEDFVDRIEKGAFKAYNVQDTSAGGRDTIPPELATRANEVIDDIAEGVSYTEEALDMLLDRGADITPQNLNAAEDERSRIDQDALFAAAQHAYMFRRAARPRGTVTVTTTDGIPSFSVTDDDEMMRLRESPLIREYNVRPFKVKGDNFVAGVRHLSALQLDAGRVLVGSVDNQLFFASPEDRARLITELNLNETLKNDIHALERIGVMLKREAGESRQVSITHIAKRHGEDPDTGRHVHDGVVAIVDGQPINQGYSVRPYYGIDGNLHYEFSKGVIRSPLQRVDSTGEVLATEAESVAASLEFGANRVDETAGGSATFTFQVMKPVAEELGGKANAQQLTFGLSDPAFAFLQDRLNEIYNMTADGMLRGDAAIRVAYGVARAAMISQDQILKLTTTVKVKSARAYVMSTDELLGPQFNKNLNEKEKTWRKAQAAEFKRRTGREYAEGVDDVLLLSHTYDEINKEYNSLHGRDLKPGDLVLLHRDPALPDASSMQVFMFQGLARLTTPEGSHNRGIVVHTDSKGWKSAAGDFDGDVGVVILPTEHIWPRMQRTAPPQLNYVRKKGANKTPINDAVAQVLARYADKNPEVYLPDNVTEATITLDGRNGRVTKDLLSVIGAEKAHPFSGMIGKIISPAQQLAEVAALDAPITVPEFDTQGNYTGKEITTTLGILISKIGQASISAKKKAVFITQALEAFEKVQAEVRIFEPYMIDPKTGLPKTQQLNAFWMSRRINEIPRKALSAKDLALVDELFSSDKRVVINTGPYDSIITPMVENFKFTPRQVEGLNRIVPFVGVRERYFSAEFSALRRASADGSPMAAALRRQDEAADAKLQDWQQEDWRQLKTFAVSDANDKGWVGIPRTRREVWTTIKMHADRVIALHRASLMVKILQTIQAKPSVVNDIDLSALKLPQYDSSPEGVMQSVFWWLHHPEASMSQELLDELSATPDFETRTPQTKMYLEYAFRVNALDRLYNEAGLFNSRKFQPEYIAAAKRIADTQWITPKQLSVLKQWKDRDAEIGKAIGKVDAIEDAEELTNLEELRANLNAEIAMHYALRNVTGAMLVAYGPQGAAGRLTTIAELAQIAEETEMSDLYNLPVTATDKDNSPISSESIPNGRYEWVMRGPDAGHFVLVEAYPTNNPEEAWVRGSVKLSRVLPETEGPDPMRSILQSAMQNDGFVAIEVKNRGDTARVDIGTLDAHERRIRAATKVVTQIYKQGTGLKPKEFNAVKKVLDAVEAEVNAALDPSLDAQAQEQQRLALTAERLAALEPMTISVAMAPGKDELGRPTPAKNAPSVVVEYEKGNVRYTYMKAPIPKWGNPRFKIIDIVPVQVQSADPDSVQATEPSKTQFVMTGLYLGNSAAQADKTAELINMANEVDPDNVLRHAFGKPRPIVQMVAKAENLPKNTWTEAVLPLLAAKETDPELGAMWQQLSDLIASLPSIGFPASLDSAKRLIVERAVLQMYKGELKANKQQYSEVAAVAQLGIRDASEDFFKREIAALMRTPEGRAHAVNNLMVGADLGVTLSTGGPGYGSRTKRNAELGDITIAFALDHNTAGEKATARYAGSKLVKYNNPDINGFVDAIVAKLTEVGGTSINVAGNGIYTWAEKGVSQERVNQAMYKILAAVKEKYPGLQTIITGGQTGSDIAGAIAGVALGLQVDLHMPDGYLQRVPDSARTNGVRDEQHSRAEIIQQIRDGVAALEAVPVPATTTEVAPEITPEVAPEITPEVIPEPAAQTALTKRTDGAASTIEPVLNAYRLVAAYERRAIAPEDEIETPRAYMDFAGDFTSMEHLELMRANDELVKELGSIIMDEIDAAEANNETVPPQDETANLARWALRRRFPRTTAELKARQESKARSNTEDEYDFGYAGEAEYYPDEDAPPATSRVIKSSDPVVNNAIEEKAEQDAEATAAKEGRVTQAAAKNAKTVTLYRMPDDGMGELWTSDKSKAQTPIVQVTLPGTMVSAYYTADQTASRDEFRFLGKKPHELETAHKAAQSAPKSVNTEALRALDDPAVRAKLQDAAANLGMLMNLGGAVKVVSAEDMYYALMQDPRHASTAGKLLAHALYRDQGKRGGSNGVHYIQDDGTHVIFVSNALTEDQQVAVLAHEIGHGIIDEAWNKLVTTNRQLSERIMAEFKKTHPKEIGGKGSSHEDSTAAAQSNEWHEWLANRIRDWLITKEAPRDAAGSWFRGLADTFIKLFEAVKNWFSPIKSVDSVDKWLSSIAKSPEEIARVYGAGPPGMSISERIQQRQARLHDWATGKMPHIEALNEVIPDIRANLENMLSPDDVAMLRREVHSPAMRRRLNFLLGGNTKAADAVARDTDTAVAYFFALATMRVMTAPPRVNNIFATLREVSIHKNRMFVEATEADTGDIIRALNLRGTTPQPQTNLIPPNSPAAILYAERRKRYHTGILGLVEKASQGYKGILGWYVDEPFARIKRTGNGPLIDAWNHIQSSAYELGSLQRNGMLERARSNYQIFDQRGTFLIKDLDEEERTKLSKYLLSPNAGMRVSPKISEVAEKLRKLMEDVWKYENLRIGTEHRADYWPMIPNHEHIMENLPEVLNTYADPTFMGPEGWGKVAGDYIKWAQKHMSEVDAGRVTAKILEMMANDPREFIQFYITNDGTRMLPGQEILQLPPDQAHTPAFRFANPRELNFLLGAARTNSGLHERVLSTLNLDPKEVMDKYFRNAVKRMEFQRFIDSLGPGGIKGLIHRAIEQGATESDIKLFQESLMAVQGTLGLRERDAIDHFIEGTKADSWLRQFHSQKTRVMNPEIQKGISATMMWTNISHLTLALAAAAVDPAGQLAKHGDFNLFLKTMSESRKMFKDMAKNMPLDERAALLRLLGVDEASMRVQDMHATYAADEMHKGTARIMDWFFRWNGVQKLTDYSRAMAGFAALSSILRWYNQVKSTDGSVTPEQKVIALRELENHGLAPDDVHIRNGHIKVLTYEEWADASDEERERDLRIRTAVHRFVDTSTVRPDAATRALVMSNPYYAIPMMWKAFSITFGTQILKPAWAKLAEEGNATPIMWLALTGIPIMLFADLLRDAVKMAFSDDDDEEGNKQWRPGWKRHWTLGDHVGYAIRRAGLYGSEELTMDLVEPVFKGRPGEALAELGGVVASDIRKTAKFGFDSGFPLPLGDLTGNWGGPDNVATATRDKSGV